MLVFPMAGRSRRFAQAGYTVPKYQLNAHGRSLFAHAVDGFTKAFSGELFVFVMLKIDGAYEFVRRQIAELNITRSEIILLDEPTRGQAETVAFGLKRLQSPNDERLTIFNIDTFRPNFSHPVDFDRHEVDGYLEVFKGVGSNWSFVRCRQGTNRVLETSEKVPISDLCCTGLYEFRDTRFFLDLYAQVRELDETQLQGGELYIAPLYNRLISNGFDIRYRLVSSQEVTFCGIPSEYEDFLSRRNK